MLFVQASLLHGTEREICCIDTLLVQASLLHGVIHLQISVDMLSVKGSSYPKRNGTEVT
jgi:hypothetical protein